MQPASLWVVMAASLGGVVSVIAGVLVAIAIILLKG